MPDMPERRTYPDDTSVADALAATIAAAAARTAAAARRRRVAAASLALRTALAAEPHLTALDLAARVVGGDDGVRAADYWRALSEAVLDGRVRTTGTTPEGAATLAVVEAGTCTQCGCHALDLDAGLCSVCGLAARLARYRAECLTQAAGAPPQEAWA